MTTLLKKDKKFDLNARCQDSFDQLKETLMKEPLLQYPDFSKEFVLTTDASNVAVGAVLSQGPIEKDLQVTEEK